MIGDEWETNGASFRLKWWSGKQTGHAIAPVRGYTRNGDRAAMNQATGALRLDDPVIVGRKHSNLHVENGNATTELGLTTTK